MKKFFTLVAVAALSIAANAQVSFIGLTPDEAATAAKTEYVTDALKYMSNEATSIKSDAGLDVTYNDQTYSGANYAQGATNAMSWAVQPTKDGDIHFAIKMGGNKKFYVIEIDANGYLEEAGEDLTLAAAYELAGGTGLCTDFQPLVADNEYVSNPSITGVAMVDAETSRTISGAWDGSAPISMIEDPEKSTPEKPAYKNEYMVLEIPAKANNVYVVGCAGSKLMVRAINFLDGTTGINNVAVENAAAPVKKVAKNGQIMIGNYNIAGQLVK